ECVRVFDEGTEQVAVRLSVRTERGCGGVEGSFEHDRAVVEWMSDGRRRVQPLETELLERQRSKERRCDRHRMNGRADVVRKAQERQLGRPNAAANGSLLLEHCDVAAAARQRDGRREAV